MSEVIQYPFDLTGEAESNLVTGTYNITKMSGELYYQFALKEGPFFKQGSVVKHVQTNKVLRYGIDYIFSYYSHTLSVEAAKVQPNDVNSEVYYGVVIQNRKLEGSISIECQVVGGDFSTNPQYISASVNENDPYASTSYDSIVDAPALLPPSSHDVPTDTLTEGFEDMVHVLNDIRASIDALGHTEGTPIEDVIGLQEALDSKISYGGGYQVKLASRSNVSNDAYMAQIKAIFPKVAELNSLLMGTIKVISDYGNYQVTVSGMVNRNGVFGDSWTNAKVMVNGTNRNLKIRATYTPEGYPVVYIGEATEVLGKVHVSIIDYGTSSLLASSVTTGWAVDFSADELATIPLISFTGPNQHTHTTSQLTGNPIIPKALNQGDNLNTLVHNDYRIYYPNFTDTEGMLDLNYPLENANFSLKVEYTSANYIRQKITYANGRAFNRVITDKGGLVVNWIEMSIVKEDTYIVSTGTELTYLNSPLATDTAFEVTLVGSKSQGDVYKAILHYNNGEWVSVATTMGSQSPTAPVLYLSGGRVTIVCFDRNNTDTSVKVMLKVIG